METDGSELQSRILFLHVFQTVMGLTGYRRFFQEEERPERVADHLPPTSAEVKKTWYIHSPIGLHGVVLN
jgi:hypothetical protein